MLKANKKFIQKSIKKSMKKSIYGFTLIELMITVAIIGILGGIAYPSYQDSIRKSRRAEGKSAMMEVLQQQERYMTQRNTYLAFTTTKTSTDTGIPFKVYSGESGKTGASYLISAEACPNQTIDTCVRILGGPNAYNETDIQQLTITSTGVKDCTLKKGTDKSICWK